MKVIKHAFFFMVLIAFLLFSSCSARISGQINQSGAADFSVNLGLKPRISGLIRSIQAFSGEVNANILDGEAIAASMSGIPSLGSVNFKNISPQSIDGNIKITKIGDFLAVGKTLLDTDSFLLFETDAAGKGGHCIININNKTCPQMLALLSPDISDYLEALMAPIVTGEVLTKNEYLDAVKSIYGSGISDEIAQSQIQVSIGFPGTVKSVKNGKSNGTKAEFDINLLDLLVLEKPLIYEVIW